MPSRIAVLRSRILWMPKASPENTSRDTARTGARGSLVFAARRKYGGRSWPDEAAISVRIASLRPGVLGPFGTRVRRGAKTMRAVIQRVRHARVSVDGRVVGEIGAGIVVLLGIAKGDLSEAAHQLAE